MKTMDMWAKVVFFLAAASFIVAGPLSGFLTEDFEEQPAKVGLKQATADISSLAQRGKSGGVPRVVAELKEDQVSEFESDSGKGGFLASSDPSNSSDCGKNPWNEPPWIVLLGNDPGGKKEPKVECLGVVVSARHVIGPAFCVNGNDVNFVMAPTETGFATVKVASTNYVPGVASTDEFIWGKNLVIVELNSSLAFSDYLQPVCLPPEDATSFINVKYRKTFVYGFRFKHGNEGDFEKFYLITETYDSDAIRKYIEEFNNRETSREIEGIHFLTKSHLGVVHDFGELLHTALFYQDESDHRFYLLGVGPAAVSLQDPVGLYVNVAHHRRWIDQVLRQ